VVKRRQADSDGLPPGRVRLTSPYDLDAGYTYTAVGSPAAVVDSKGGVQVFTRKAADGDLLETVDYAGTNTSGTNTSWGEEDLSNRADYNYPMTGSPTAVIDSVGGIHVFAQKPNDRNLLETVDHSANNTWGEEDLTNITGR
jgi:hypothetical protein